MAEQPLIALTLFSKKWDNHFSVTAKFQLKGPALLPFQSLSPGLSLPETQWSPRNPGQGSKSSVSLRVGILLPFPDTVEENLCFLQIPGPLAYEHACPCMCVLSINQSIKITTPQHPCP